jgi:hypothetical protein
LPAVRGDGRSGVNLLLCATTHGNSGVAASSPTTRPPPAALEAHIQYPIRPAVTVKMANLPGADAATFHKLAAVGINVDPLLPVRISDDEFYAVICADDPAAAEGALGGQVVSG